MRALTLLLCLLTLPVQAEVYRWVDAQGNVHYGDRSPQRAAQPAKLPPLQLIPGQPSRSSSRTGTRPVQSGSETMVLNPASFPVRVVSPKADEVFRQPDRSLPISVALDKNLPAGSGLIFRVDGNPANRAPIQASTFTATGIDRGSHLVDVSVVDASGRELGRSAPVLVHLKPPGVR